MRFVVGLLAGWLVALVTTAVLTVAAAGLLHVASATSQGALVGRPQILVAAAVVLLLGSFSGGLSGGRYLKGAGRTWVGMLVGVAVIVSTGLHEGHEFIVDPVGHVAVPLGAALVGGLVGVALARPAAAKDLAA
jgi:hypothetical protein